MGQGPYVFGIRHLSPAGAYYVRDFLDQVSPRLVLIEGPSDFTDLVVDLGAEGVKPPVAVMAYTKELPIRTVLYPFAEYSPEYQALLWAREHGRACRFCDLPSDVFLGMRAAAEAREAAASEAGTAAEAGEPAASEAGTAAKPEAGQAARETPGKAGGLPDLYKALDEQCPDKDHETFWERTMEQAGDWAGYEAGAKEFGRSLRELESRSAADFAENLVREAYMRRQIACAGKEGFALEEIVLVTGAYHVEGISGDLPAMTDKEEKALPRLESMKTLMPYSYYRLSEHSGYGAGNRAPAYYEYLWQGLCRQEPNYGARRYLTGLAAYERAHGGVVSPAEVLEAARLSLALAELHGSRIPALKDLRDGAVTCMGHGAFSEISLAVAHTEIGTRIGSLPQGVSQTSIQNDFYQKLKELKLEKYKSVTVSQLSLDLRENLRVKTKASAFLDLNRSFFLHQLRVLGIQFASVQAVRQDNATWAEQWNLRWTPEAEIQIVEAVLKGDTVEQAAAFELKSRMEGCTGISRMAGIVREAFYCGMPVMVASALKQLQAMAVDAAGVAELADTAESLSVVIQYGDIRKLDRAPLVPILSQLFLRACLILPGECACDDQAASALAEAVGRLAAVGVAHDFLDTDRWNRVLKQVAARDDLNTRLSGLAAAILLEQGKMDSEELGREVERRLSRGIPADLGAGWFAGLSSRNHYALIGRLTLWEKLSGYLDTLDDEEFKRALLFLRRAFADYSSMEKDQIAENLGEIWQVNPEEVSQVLGETLTEDAMELLEGLEDFDFGDI